MNERPHVLLVTERWCDCSPRVGPTNTEHNLYDSLLATGFANCTWVCYDEYALIHGRRCDQALINLCTKNPADVLVFALLPAHEASVQPSTILSIRELGIPAVAIWTDSAVGATESIPGIDVNVTWDTSAPAREMDRILHTWTPQSPRLYYDPMLYRDILVSHIGSLSHKPLARDYISFLSINGIRIYTAGGQREDKLSPEEYAGLFMRSKITLNFPRNTSTHAPQLKGRVFESTMCGALLLEEENSETSKWLIPMQHYVPFSSPNDLLDKVVYYLNHDTERMAIAAAGRDFVQNAYSAKAFWKLVLGSVGLEV